MNAVQVESIWLNRVGGENDPHAKAVVMVKLKGEDFYREVIMEALGDNFSHAIHGDAIAKSPIAVRVQ